MPRATTFYRTGEVARLLGTSLYHIRRLCEAGVIRAEQTNGKHWKVFASEVERMRKDGLPAPPAGAGSTETHPGAQIAPAAVIIHRRRPAEARVKPSNVMEPEPDYSYGEDDDTDSDYARYSDPDTQYGPEVQIEKDSLTIAQTQLQRRRVELERESVEDSFRARDRQKLEHEAQAKEAQVRLEIEQARRSWIDSWLKTALLTMIPSDVSGELKLQICLLVHKTLLQADMRQSQFVISSLVDAAVSQGLQPYHQSKERERAIQTALGSLPYGTTEATQARARQAADSAVSKLNATQARSSHNDMVATARVAIEPILLAIKHEEAKQRILSGLHRHWSSYYEATEGDRKEVIEAVRDVLERLPVGTSEDRMQKRAESELAPFDQRVRRRTEAEKETLQTEIEKRRAEQTANSYLWRVGFYIRENWKFDTNAERDETERDCKAQLLKLITKRILAGRLQSDEIPEFMDSWLDDQSEDDEE